MTPPSVDKQCDNNTPGDKMPSAAEHSSVTGAGLAAWLSSMPEFPNNRHSAIEARSNFTFTHRTHLLSCKADMFSNIWNKNWLNISLATSKKSVKVSLPVFLLRYII